MPLHLLGKKSWNVYNPEAIAKVRRDEAEAAARDAEEERRLQEHDAEQRIARLRGIEPSKLLEGPARPRDEPERPELDRSRKRRKLAGEDDTDMEMRLARQETTGAQNPRKSLTNNAPIFDSEGHIDLVPQQNVKSRGKNAEAQAEAEEKRRSYEDQYTMRLSNASGMKPGSDKPWYSSTAVGNGAVIERSSKDVWGNEDPRRKDREKRRIDATDPLAAMKKGVKQLRKAEASRKEWMEQREKDLREVEVLARKERKHKRRRHSDAESLEDFDLDKGYSKDDDACDRLRSANTDRYHRRHHRHRDRKRSRSPHRDRQRH